MDLQSRVRILLNSNLYNLFALAKGSGVSRYYIAKIINNEDVPEYIYLAIDNFIKKWMDDYERKR